LPNHDFKVNPSRIIMLENAIRGCFKLELSVLVHIRDGEKAILK
jgi:hypothetical protein